MARRCIICGRAQTPGHTISHAHNVSKRRFYVNLQRVRAKINGEVKRVWVCTSCLKAGKIERA